MTLLYLGLLALVIIAFAALTYFLLARVLAQETDANLVEMARSFETEVHSEKSDDEEKLTAEKEFAESVGDFRFRDYGFVVFGKDGRRIASTLTDASLERDLAGLIDAEKSQPSFAVIAGASGGLRTPRTSFARPWQSCAANPKLRFQRKTARPPNTANRWLWFTTRANG